MFKKRRVIVLLTFLFLLSIFALPSVSHAADKSETEPNDSNSTATPMELDTWYMGNVDKGRDNDYYKIILPSDGNIEVLYNNDGGLESDPVIYVVNGDDESYVGMEGRGDLVGSETTFVSLPKGEYFIKVKDSYSWNYDYSYKIKVNFTAGDFYEKEFNDNFYTATSIALGKEYTGSASDGDDDDYYKFNLDNPGKLRVCYNNDESKSSWDPKISVLNGQGYEYLKFEGPSDLVGDECANIGLDSGEYYIKVDPYYSEGYHYTLNTTFTATDYYEKEANNDISTANLLQLNTAYNGEFNESYEYDYYKFTLPHSGKINLKVGFKADNSADMDVTLVDGRGNEYLDFSSKGNTDFSSQVLTAGEYYVKLKADNYYGYNYSLAVYDEQLERIKGTDRFDTAIEISKAGWTSAETVILTRWDNFADALAGVPLAYKLDAPILMTKKNELQDEVSKEIRRLGAKEVVILGGTGAVSEEVFDQLERMRLDVRRVSGETRFETAALIAEEVAPKGTDKVVVANGMDFPDALSVASHAAKQGLPILLTQTNTLPGVTKSAINDLGAKDTIVVGGTVAVSEKLEKQLPNALRLRGATRYETNIAIAEHFGVESKHLYVATGNGFADALTGAVLSAKNDSAIVLVGNTVNPKVSKYIKDHNTEKFSIFGGDVAVSGKVVSDLEKLLK